MPSWQRVLVTLGVILLTSFLAGVLWRSLFNTEISGYLSGVIGGIMGVPVWEFLKRIEIK
jgi:hypothetical protein